MRFFRASHPFRSSEQSETPQPDHSAKTAFLPRPRRGTVEGSLALVATVLACRLVMASAVHASSQAQSAPNTPSPTGQPMLALQHIAFPTVFDAGRSIRQGSGAYRGRPAEANDNSALKAADNRRTCLPLVSWGKGAAVSARLELVHNSRSRHLCEIGGGWTHTYDIYGVLDPQKGGITVHWSDDRSDTFMPPQGKGSSVGKAVGTRAMLVPEPNGTFTVLAPDKVRYHLDRRLCCDHIADGKGHSLSIARNPFGCVTQVRDSSGHRLDFQYAGGSHLIQLQDETGRQWQLDYVPQQHTLDLAQITCLVPTGPAESTHIAYDGKHAITAIRKGE